MRILVKGSLVLGLLFGLVLSGCGFHLRGSSVLLPDLFKKTYFKENLVIDDNFERRVKDLIVAGGGKLVSREQADVGVALSEVNVRSRQVALSSSGSTKEYERTYKATVTVTDLKTGAQLGSREVSTVRNLQLDSGQVLAGEEQSVTTQKEAERSLAQAVMRYLKTF